MAHEKRHARGFLGRGAMYYTLKITFVIISLFTLPAWPSTLKDLPGSIPLQYERQAASDLVYQGKTLLPDEARKLFENGPSTP